MPITRRGFLRGALGALATVITGRKITVATAPAPESVPLTESYGVVPDICGDCRGDRDCYFFCNIRDGPRDEVGEPELMILPEPYI